MKHIMFLAGAIVAATAIQPSFAGPAQDTKGKDCRMEQQCRWENFKKVCIYVKVCR